MSNHIDSVAAIESEDIIPLEISDSPNKNNLAGKAKEMVEDLETSITKEEIFLTMGVSPESSFLVYGPPGTGKSLAVQVLNNHINSNSYIEEVKIPVEKSDPENEKKSQSEIIYESLTRRRGIELFTLPYDIGRYGTAYINMGSRNMQRFFDEAYDIVENGGKALLEFDEVDALLGSRTGGTRKHGEDTKLMNTLMKNMQISHDTPGIFMVFISNIPEECDFAAFRSGRIDRRYEFSLPNKEERMDMFQVAIDKRNEIAGYGVIEKYNCEELADLSRGLSYADIDNATESAVRERANELAKNDIQKIVPPGSIRQKRIEKHIGRLKSYKNENRIGWN